jgi:hypothetical protein
MFLDRLRRKKEEVALPTEIPTELPEDLERFRVRTPDVRPGVGELPFTKQEEISSRNDDKIELILQKLETIDARLRLIEEKMKTTY